MRNLLLSVALIAAPAAVFAAGYSLLAPPAATQSASGPSLGDMTPYETITTDVQKTAASGDLAAAETRITDLETAWDKAEPDLRPVDPAAWGNVDTAIDDALGALRAPDPDPAKVEKTLAGLQDSLAHPSASSGGAEGVATVSGIAVTDANGHALPCEVMLDKFRTSLAGASLSDADKATATDLQAKGTERCNADDDTRADAFFARGLALTAS